ncbi:hypothetical protein [Herbidospora yilanensis]|uniref:hypothetical protein n=1 Tax=Herbidospora yilanensis TaxID=354426 RepID=UPI0007857837|nr:hypothetical protein [Herbidospora yilanensis]
MGEQEIHGTIVDSTPQSSELTHLCHHGCDCWQRNFDRYVRTTPPRRANDLDHVEAGALLDAKNRSARLVRQHAEAMNEGRERLIRLHEDASRTVTALQAELAQNRLAKATRDLERVRESQIDSGSFRPPRWLRWSSWPLVVLAGGFDTWYFQRIFQRFVGNDQLVWHEQLLTLVPGVLLTAGIIVAGHSLGRARWHARIRAKHKTRPLWSVLFSRFCTWITRAILPTMLITSIALWASFRTAEVGRPRNLAPALVPNLVILLMVTLTLCALAVKVAAYDPFGEDEASARRRFERASRQVTGLDKAAGEAVRSFATAWSDLSALRDEVVGKIAERYGEAYHFMMYARGFHTQAGPIPPAFATATAGIAVTTLERLGPAFDEIDQPEPELAALRQVEDELQRYHPDQLKDELTNARRDRVNQSADKVPLEAEDGDSA